MLLCMNMSTTNRLIVIRGNSASGKSTLARRVQKEASMPVAVIEQDYFRHDLFGSAWGDVEYHARSALMVAMTLQLLRSGVTVILEGSLPSKWFTEVLRAIQKEWHGEVAAFCYVLELEETVCRHQTRDKRTHFGEETLREWYSERDPIEGLHEDILDKAVTLDHAVQRVLNAIKGCYETDRKYL
jgi:predicted kinase